jgi:predicted flap endonuclease-1-like 5' DNA nuclease
LWIVGTAVLGFFFAALGFSQRPKTRVAPVEIPSRTPAPEPVQPSPETVKTQETPVIIETAAPALEITQVKGIKIKRAEQLKALGINNVQDLANASAKNLATKLQISPKFTQQWIDSAKELVEKA